MQFLILVNPDFGPFDAQKVERAFRDCPEFTNVRLDEPCGALLECEYNEPEDGTIIRLSQGAERISVYHTWGAALRATILIQKSLKVPLRVFNDDYTFDLTFSDILTVEELEAAMENARTN